MQATDGFPGDDFGVVVAADGDWFAVRSRLGTYVYRDLGSGPVLEVQFPSPEIQPNPGLSDSLSLKGDLMAAGYPQGDGPTPKQAPRGTVHIYRRANGLWAFEQELVSSDTVLGTNFGDAVDVDGDTLIVGAPRTTKIIDLPGGQQNAFTEGAAFIFERVGGVWTEITKLIPPDDPQDTVRFGNAVAIEGDFMVIGAFFDEPVTFQSGSAYIYRRIAGSWVFQEKLIAPTPIGGAQFGRSVSIHSGRLAIGAPRDLGTSDSSGKVYLYDLKPSGVELVQQLVPSSTVFGDNFGQDVALYGDRLVVGACYADSSVQDSGSVHVFDAVNGIWIPGPILESPQSIQAELSGWSVAVNDAGIYSGMLIAYGGQTGPAGSVRSWVGNNALNCKPQTYGQLEGASFDLTVTPVPAFLGQDWLLFAGPVTPVPFAYLLFGPQPNFLPVEGSAVLVDPGTYFLAPMGVVLGSYASNIPIPANLPELNGKTFYAQVGTLTDLVSPQLVLSPGLAVTLCP